MRLRKECLALFITFEFDFDFWIRDEYALIIFDLFILRTEILNTNVFVLVIIVIIVTSTWTIKT